MTEMIWRKNKKFPYAKMTIFKLFNKN